MGFHKWHTRSLDYSSFWILEDMVENIDGGTHGTHVTLPINHKSQGLHSMSPSMESPIIVQDLEDAPGHPQSKFT